MIVCPTCRYPVTIPTAVVDTVDRGGVRGRRITCPTCATVFTVTVVILEPSPHTPARLAKIRNQYRGEDPLPLRRVLRRARDDKSNGA